MIKFILPLTFLILSNQAYSDWYFQPKLGLETRDYQIKFDTSNKAATSNITGLTIGFSIIHSSSWYLDIDISNGEGKISEYFPEDDYIAHLHEAISIGFSFPENLTLFAGYNSNETDIENQNLQPNQPNEVAFDTSGFFSGLAKTFRLNEKHSLNLSGAFGIMDGTYSINYYSGSGSDEAKGSSTGYSASISYNYRITKKGSLTVGAKTQKYTYSDMESIWGNGALSDLEENINSYFSKISYLF